MAINLKDEAAVEELRQLSRLTGRSMSQELAAAVHERLTRVELERATRLEGLLALAQSSAALWPDDQAAGDPTADLYDPLGLPT